MSQSSPATSENVSGLIESGTRAPGVPTLTTDQVIDMLVESSSKVERAHLGLLLRIKIEGDCIAYARQTLKLVQG